MNPSGAVIRPDGTTIGTQGVPGQASINQQPLPSQTGVLGASTTATSTTPSYILGVNDPATLASYDQGIANTQSAVNRLPGQLTTGNSAIDASYTNALNQLLLGKNQAQSTYDTNKTQTGQDYVTAKNTIGSNAGNSLNGLLRLLGSRGAGGGTAYNEVAPGAVAQDATQQRTAAGTTFGENNQALDTNWNNYLTGYNNSVSGANSQKDQEDQQLQQQIATNRATLLQSLAQLTGEKAAATGANPTTAAQPYLNQANQILDSTNSYTTAPINYSTAAYSAPSLASYTTNPSAAPTYNGQAPTSDYVSPYLAALLGKKQQTA